jgi:hypothetical protein
MARGNGVATSASDASTHHRDAGIEITPGSPHPHLIPRIHLYFLSTRLACFHFALALRNCGVLRPSAVMRVACGDQCSTRVGVGHVQRMRH